MAPAPNLTSSTHSLLQTHMHTHTVLEIACLWWKKVLKIKKRACCADGGWHGPFLTLRSPSSHLLAFYLLTYITIVPGLRVLVCSLFLSAFTLVLLVFIMIQSILFALFIKCHCKLFWHRFINSSLLETFMAWDSHFFWLEHLFIHTWWAECGLSWPLWPHIYSIYFSGAVVLVHFHCQWTDSILVILLIIK